MKLESIKDLEKVIKLCRKLGVNAIKIDGVEFALSTLNHSVKPKTFSDIATSTSSFVPNGITEDMKIVTDELTDEQLLFYSATGNEQ